ncbi:MAG: hypothetical protein IPM63_09985 [Acidobacteriota bacterium]|nr:MAG: hypothetical protein IPM63_09985 [Acidobacteriota bacterium]
MAEVKTYTFAHRDVATALIKEQGIHEGLWELSLRFGLNAANIELKQGPPPATQKDPGPDDNFVPAAIVSVVSLELNRAMHETNLVVDAAKVNPLPKKDKGKKPPAKK